MDIQAILSISTIFIIAIFLGVELISKVPAILHTPLMSGSNAVSGITIIGALAVSTVVDGQWGRWIALAAIFFAMINVVGGFVVTHRMLKKFKK